MCFIGVCTWLFHGLLWGKEKHIHAVFCIDWFFLIVMDFQIKYLPCKYVMIWEVLVLYYLSLKSITVHTFILYNGNKFRHNVYQKQSPKVLINIKIYTGKCQAIQYQYPNIININSEKFWYPAITPNGLVSVKLTIHYCLYYVWTFWQIQSYGLLRIK